TRGLVVNGDGSFYVVNSAGVLWRVSPDGVKTQVASGLGDTRGLVVNGDGSFYVVNSAGVLWRVSPDGVKTQAKVGLYNATSLAVDGDGDFYYATAAGVLWRVPRDGVKSQVATALGRTQGVVMDGDGNLYITNSAGVVWRVSPGGAKSQVASNIGSGAVKASGVALDGEGGVFVAAPTANVLYRLPRVAVPLNSPPDAPTVSTPKNKAVTDAFSRFQGKALAENGAVDADKVRILDDDGIVLQTVDVRQTDGYFSWTRNGAWRDGLHSLKFVAVRDGKDSAPTSLRFIVEPGLETPTVNGSANNEETGPKPKFSGRAPGAEQVVIQNADNTTIGRVPVRGDGYFSWTPTISWSAGPHTLQFVAKNAQGLSAPKRLKSVVHIPAPEVAEPVQNSATGSLPKFSGTAPPNSSVVLYNEENKKIGTSTVDSSGKWVWHLTDERGIWLNWARGIHKANAYTVIAGSQALEHTTVTFTVK
ncbi:hypothetical protein ACWF95_41065, partial [Streptomyces vinaceus]